MEWQDYYAYCLLEWKVPVVPAAIATKMEILTLVLAAFGWRCWQRMVDGACSVWLMVLAAYSWRCWQRTIAVLGF